MKLYLSDFVDPLLRYTLEDTSGRVTKQTFSDAKEAEANCAGFASRVTVGLVRRSSEFVAFYSNGTTLILRVEDRVFDFGIEDLCAEWTRTGLFVRRFCLRQMNQTKYDVRYWALEWREWPDNGDIFSFVARITADKTTMLRNIYLWSACADGKNITDKSVVGDMEQWVQNRQHSA